MKDWLTWNILEGHPIKAGVTKGSTWSHMALQSGASEAEIQKERSLYCHCLNLPKKAFGAVNQVHSTDYQIINKTNETPAEADALLTENPGILLNIFTADCLSVVLYDPENNIAAVVHAGWKGSVNGICSNVVQAMSDNYQSRPSEILACFGPSIRKCCYEVKDDMKQKAFQADREAERFFITDNSVMFFDLEGYNRMKLIKAGILENNMESLDLCTNCSNINFPSWRRDKGHCGRLVTSVMLT